LRRFAGDITEPNVAAHDIGIAVRWRIKASATRRLEPDALALPHADVRHF
jgi:hypothetical protein